MKKLLGAMLLFVLMVSGLRSQPALRILTNPKVPPGEVLDRLNLTVAWRTKLPTAGQRDGLFTLQLLPAKNKTQLVVQTNFGGVFMLDAETGDFLWRASVGVQGWSGQPIGFNERNIFAIRRDMLYVLNRANGAQRYYTVNRDTKLPDYGFQLPAAPSAAPSADEETIFFAMNNRVKGYLLPNWEEAEAAVKVASAKDISTEERQEILEKTSALPPLIIWSYQEAGMNIEQPVLINSRAKRR